MQVNKKQKTFAIKSKVILFIIVLLLSLTGFGVYRYNRPLPDLKVTVTAPRIEPRPVSLPWTESGESAIATASNKRLGQGAAADTSVPTASIAKLITILTVLKKHPLKAGESGPTITLSQADVDRYSYYNAIDGSTVAVAVGEQISEYQMLQAMLLPSANNIADSLAIWAYGSLSAYRTAAQDVVNHLGMGRTLVGSDASGFLPDTTSTANDLIKLGQAALKQSVITEIAAQKVATIPVEGTIYSTNPDLGESGITGLKTGTSDQAGNCFLFSATHAIGGHNETFVGVILDSPTSQSRFTEALSLLDAIYSNYKTVTLAGAQQPVGTITSAWGESVGVAPTKEVSELIWSGDTAVSRANVSLQHKVSLEKGAEVGTLTAGSDSIPLVTIDTLNPPSFWWRILRP